jgi:quercetin dioxygenase-like cupin family protein
MKETLKLRLQDEMFGEFGLQPGQQIPLPHEHPTGDWSVIVIAGPGEGLSLDER